MLDNIFSILAKLGFESQKRAISVQFSNAELNSQLILQRIDGYHGINEGLSAELICLSPKLWIKLQSLPSMQASKLNLAKEMSMLLLKKEK